MSYNGSGTFQINTSGQPVVAGTVISSTAFNALTADLATGLSTAITKDGQTTTTARIPFAAGINSSLVTDSTNSTSGSIITAGGVGVAKAVFIGTTLNVTGASTMTGAIAVDSVTDSTSTTTGSIQTDGGVGIAKALYVGTTANVAGAVTLQSTLGVTGVATFSAAPIYSSLTASSAVATDASKALVSVTNTGTGNNVLATSPTLVTPVLGAASATSVTFDAGAVGTPSITTTGDTNTGIFFPAADTIAFSEGGTESMRIDSAGNVGIGTSSPSTRLHASGTDTNPVALRLQNTTASTGKTWQITSTNAGSLQLATIAGVADYLTVDSSGNFLMGLAKGGFPPWTATSGDAWGARIGSTYAISANNSDIVCIFNRTTTTGTIVELKYNSSVNGSISTNGTNVAYNTSSDYRLKENIAPMTGALEKVALLKPCTYKWKVDGSDGQGFIAHELDEVVQGCVTGEKDAVDADGNPKYQGIDTSFLVATLTAAIQEQQALITALTARITALETP